MKTNINNAVAAVAVETKSNGESRAVQIPLNRIEPNNYNARKTYDFGSLKELAQNISTHGVIQPITVRSVESKDGEARYEIICGERRYRACLSLNLPTIPAIVREASDDEAYDLSISENLQREDVPPMEAAEAYKRLIATERYDVKSLALQFGKSEKYIYQTLKLCELIPEIAKLVKKGILTAAAGIVVSKYDKKIQEEILKERLGEDGKGEWCHVSASALERNIQNCYTNNLANYRFDKTECLTCNSNSSVYDLFACGNDCGKCANKECLAAKQTAHLVAEAERIATSDPKITFVETWCDNSKSIRSEATKTMREAGHEFKDINSHGLNKYPEAPIAPQSFDFKKPDELARAQKSMTKS